MKETGEDEVDEEFDNWCSVINDTKFNILKFSRRFQGKQSRLLKLYVPSDEGFYDPRDSRIVISHVDKHRQEIVFLRDLKYVKLSASEDRMVSIDYTDSTSDKGGQSILFSNFAERQMFAHFVRLLSGEVQILSESEWAFPDTTLSVDANDNTKVFHKCETVSSLGLRTEVTVILDYAMKSINISIGSGDSIECPLDLATVITPSNSSTKLDLLYRVASSADMMTTGGGSTGIHVLQKALDEKNVASSSKKKRTMLLFQSPYARERFAARFRAIKLGAADSSGRLMEKNDLAVNFNGEMMRIFCGTFNVGDKKPPVEKDLDLWLKSGEFDLYAIGLQECSCSKQWSKAIISLLCGENAVKRATRRLTQTSLIKHVNASYSVCGREHLWDIHIILIARGDIASKISSVATATEATGFAHVLGNKGAVAVALTLDDTTRICFLSSHLAARAERCRKREENYQEICAGMKKLRRAPSDPVEWVHACNHIFFMGDLNFRIDMGTHGTPDEFDRVLSLTRSNDLARLQAADTLMLQMQQRSCFVGFVEGAINFLPTYRMIKGAEGYNNKKNQNPSYCDRVLYYSDEGAASENLSLLWYESIPSITLSDHRPVCAGFEFLPKTPYLLQQGLLRTGAMDECVVLLQGLTFIRAPEPSRAKLTSWQQSFAYDGSDAPVNFEVRADGHMFTSNISSKHAAPCVNPETCADYPNYCGVGADEVEKSIWTGGMPCWTYRDNLVLRPTIADAEWLCLQTVTVAISLAPKGHDSESSVKTDNFIGSAKIPLQEAFSASVITQRDLRESRMSHTSRGSQGGSRMSSGGFGGEDDPFGDHASDASMTAFSTAGLSENQIGCPSYSRQSNESGGNTKAKERKAWDKSIIEDGHVSLSAHLQSVYAPQEDDFEDVEEGGFGGLSGGTSNGTFFSVPVLLHGKWVGVLCGRAEMIPLNGVTDVEELDATKDQLLLWHDLTMRMRREANKNCKSGGHSMNAASTVQQQVAQSVKVSRKASPESPISTEGVRPVSTLQFVSGNKVEGHSETQQHRTEMAKDVLRLGTGVNNLSISDVYFSETRASQDDQQVKESSKIPASFLADSQNQTLILNFNVKRQRVLDKERKSLILQFQVEEDDEKFDDTSDDEEEVSVKFSESSSSTSAIQKSVEITSGLVWMEGDRVVTKDGRRMVLTPELGGPELSEEKRFVCSVTGEGLGDENDFIVQKRTHIGEDGELLEFFSRTGFLKLYADMVDAATLQPLKEHDHFVTALGGYKFKTENFRCAHSGIELFGMPFFESGGRAYSEPSYLELFHSCPGCLEPVALDAEDKVIALGCVWHSEHLKCVGCSEDTVVAGLGQDVDNCFAHDAGDGKGFQPYCEACYKSKFCPRCEGCGDSINPQTEDILEAAGACWHTDHFRCVDSGKPLDADYFTVEGLPYSHESFFKLFGKQCMVCKELITGDIRVEAMEHHWHQECFICSATGLPLIESSIDTNSEECEFWSHQGKPYCRSAFFDLFAERCFFCNEAAVLDLRVTTAHLSPQDLLQGDVRPLSSIENEEESSIEVRRVYHPECLHCVASGIPLDGNDDNVFLGDDDGLPYSEVEYLSKFRSKSALTGEHFKENEEIFIMQGLPLTKTDLTQVFHEHWCAGCAGAITGKLQVTPTIGGFKWHPDCLATFRADSETSESKVNPFETDKMRVETNLKAKQLFKDKAARRVEEKNDVLLRARARCVDARRASRKEAELAKAEKKPEDKEGEGIEEPAHEPTISSNSDLVVEIPKTVIFEEVYAGVETDAMSPPVPPSPPPPPVSSPLSILPERASSHSLPALPAYTPIACTSDVAAEEKLSKPSRRPTISNECRGLLWKQGGGSSMFGAKSWKQRWFVLLPGGLLTYYKDEADWIAGKQPLKDALYKIKSCSVSNDVSTKASVGSCGLIIQPRNLQGGPRRMVVRLNSEAEKDQWLTALNTYTKK